MDKGSLKADTGKVKDATVVTRPRADTPYPFFYPKDKNFFPMKNKKGGKKVLAAKKPNTDNNDKKANTLKAGVTIGADSKAKNHKASLKVDTGKGKDASVDTKPKPRPDTPYPFFKPKNK